MKRLSMQEWQDRINRVGKRRFVFVSWVGDKFGSEARCVTRCLVDGLEWESRVSNLVHHKRGCPRCGGSMRWTQQERERQIASVGKVVVLRWIDGVYRNISSRAIVSCVKCNLEFTATLTNLLHHRSGCPKCAKQKIKEYWRS